MYSELSSTSRHHQQHQLMQDQLRHIRHKYTSDFIDLSDNTDNIEIFEKSNLQLYISPDEFCRNIDTILDDQFSFTFSKVYGSRYLVAPPQMLAKDNYMNKHKRDEILRFNRSINTVASRKTAPNNYNYMITHVNCKFPKWFNRKWYNFKQTKSFQLDYRLDSLFVFDEKNSVIINKYTCMHMKSKRVNHVQVVVKSLNGW